MADAAVRSVAALPHPWPAHGSLDATRTALISIDWQVEACAGMSAGGDAAIIGDALTRAVSAVALARSAGWMVVHTREGHRADLSDCPTNKLWRSRQQGQQGIGDPGPNGRRMIRGEPGWEIVPELTPLTDDVVIDKPGKGAFFATELDVVLRRARITHLVITGSMVDAAVHTTMCEANDRGFECLLLADAVGAADAGSLRAALEATAAHGGWFGVIATLADVAAVMTR